MNAYEKAQQLGLTGTDAEIVAILKTLTQADIPGKALEFGAGVGILNEDVPTSITMTRVSQ